MIEHEFISHKNITLNILNCIFPLRKMHLLKQTVTFTKVHGI